MPPIPRTKHDDYTEEQYGMSGELGDGANAKIRFLQTVLRPSELDSVKLISNISGSERWDVRDLFQRDVDSERVSKEILPYLKDKTKVKFFNPLTLVILPMDESNKTILKELEYVQEKKEILEDQPATIYERNGFFKFVEWEDGFGKIKWNRNQCNIVAIDGQHRLSALKRWHNEMNMQNNDLDKWKIPVVILCLFKIDPVESTANLLEIVRRTFVYINKKAHQVNRARELLLDDESVNAICTQEIIRYSHENDCKDLAERDESILPLIFLDWRGDVKKSPASIKNIEEIHDWLQEYILDQNFGLKQEIELDIDEAMPPLTGWESKNLSHEDVSWVRQSFREKVMDGILYLLNEFLPYKRYIEGCRKLEKDHFHNGNDAAQFAFMKLRFGAHDAPYDRMEEVDKIYKKLVVELGSLKKQCFDELIELDIGMRAFIYAFAKTKELLEKKQNGEGPIKSVKWLDHAHVFTKTINILYDDGWFKGYYDLQEIDRQKLSILTFLAFDEGGNIANYKLTDVPNAFGALLVLLVMKSWRDQNMIDADFLNIVWEDISLDMNKPVGKGCRKKANAKLINTVIGTRADINAAIKAKAKVYTQEYFDELQRFLGVEL